MSHVSRDETDQINIIRTWKIICDRVQAEIVWNSLRRIHVEGRNLFPEPPIKYIRSKWSHEFTVICCNMSANCKDETTIRQVAEFIRERIDYPFPLQCFDFDRNTRRYQKCRFIHSPEGEFYRNTGYAMELIDLNPSSKLDKIVRGPSFLTALWPDPLPSEVVDKEYLYLPSTEEAIANLANEKGGKWMLYSPANDMARHDHFFLAMVSLYQKGIFVGLKCMTAMINLERKVQTDACGRDGLLILCYTDNSEDRDDVLRAARAIRSVIENEYIIYYKTNRASIDGEYNYEGKFNVTKYNYTVGGVFNERDYLDRFKLVVPSSSMN